MQPGAEHDRHEQAERTACSSLQSLRFVHSGPCIRVAASRVRTLPQTIETGAPLRS